MNDFIFYIKLGIQHILDIDAYDHVLFLLTLSLPFVFKQLRQLVLLVTVFTLGHTLSMWGASAGIIRINSNWIELLIPITIALTALHVLYWNNSITAKSSAPFIILTAFFGVIHGLGFASYFSMVFPNKGFGLPLVYFTLGIEVAQILVVSGMIMLNSLASHLGFSKRDRLIVCSSVIIGILVPVLHSSIKAI